uniref:Ig-like domain-containing protein n=1 Tax=Erpetoichthys calabaricus TaxID=27687 RepID=A0A8C4X8A3_ERPCA
MFHLPKQVISHLFVEPAKIVEKTTSISVTAGDPATLECTIEGSPELQIKWFKDRREITSGRKYKMSFKENVATLKIFSAEKVDITNADFSLLLTGSLASYRIVPPTFTKPLRKVDGVVGSAVSMECRVSGSQPMTVSWFKDEQEISADAKYQPEDNEVITGGACFIRKESLSSFLELHSVKPLDSGKYTCQVSNDAGKVSCTAKLDASKLLMTGSSVHLECKVTGTPEIQIKWLKNESEISAGDTYQMSFTEDVASLHIFNASVEESGDYICEACNDAGTDRCNSLVIVKELLNNVTFVSAFPAPPDPPSFIEKIENVSCLVGSVITLQSIVKGSLPITVSWIKDDNEVMESDNTQMTFEDGVATLYMTDVETLHAGKYTCQAKNDAGAQKCSASVLVKGQSAQCTMR